MSRFKINVKNTAGNKGSLPDVPDIGFSYTDKLNDMNEGFLKLSGSSVSMRGLFGMGSEIEIYKDGVSKLLAIVDMIDFLDGGALRCHYTGFEFWLAKENGAYASSPWKNTAVQTITAAIIAESNYLTAGTIETPGVNLDFRASVTDSLWNALSNCVRKAGQDIQIDYTNKEIDILNSRGSALVASFNDGIDITNLRYSQTYPLGNKIIVYGKSDGVNQIVSESGHGQDAASQGSYGIITRPVIDRTIMSVSEANQLADIEVPKTKDPTDVYDFEVINPNISLIAGDTIKLTSKDKGLTGETVKIIGIERGMRNSSEFLTLQVTNSAYAALMKSTEQIVAEMKKEFRDNVTYMQGSGNTTQFSNARNGDSTRGLKINFDIDSTYEDEADNLRVKSMKLDFDIDEYNRQYGSVSENNENPALDGATATDSHKHDATDSGHLHSDPSQTSSSEGGSSQQADSGNTANNFTVKDDGTWLTVDTISPGNYHTAGMHVFLSCKRSIAASDFTLLQFRIKRGAYAFGNPTYSSVITVPININFTAETYDEISYCYAAFYVPEDTYGNTYTIEVKEAAGGGGGDEGTWVGSTSWNTWQEHAHTISTHNVDSDNAAVTDSNKTPGVTGNTVNHNHSVSIGDGTGEAGSVNATNVVIDLDFWNGSNWVNKHSITPSPASLLSQDVDLTDSGTYPDAKGWWRIHLKTNNASADLIQGIVKLQHALDN